MKLKKLKEIFAWAAFGFVFANMPIVANAEELPEEKTDVVVPGQEDSAETDTVVPGQEDSVETDTEEQTGPADFAEAEKNLENAKKEEEKAKAEVDNAQTEFDSAQSDMDQAEQDVADAAAALDQAQTGKEDAETTKENAEQSVSETEQAVKNAEESLDQILADGNINEDDYNSACEELEQKEAEVKETEQNVAEAEDKLDGKQNEVTEAEEETKKAEEDLESAKEEKAAADQAVSDAQTNVDIAQKEYDDALNAEVPDIVEDAKGTKEEAGKTLTAVQEKIASGSLGFFQTMAQEEGAAGAQAAVTILTSRDQTEVAGLDSKDGWATEVGSWEDFISHTHIGDENDATNLQNMRKVFEYLEECNSLRTSDKNFPGCAELMVNDALMAIAQLNANWAADIIAVHSSVFNTGENLAWYPEGDDPFRGWYDKEKEYYDEGNREWDSKNGHYLNITNGRCYATGYAINSYAVMNSGSVNYAHAQEFNFESNIEHFGYGDSYSLSEYKERFMSYYDGVMAELASAQKAYDAAQKAYEQALAGESGDANQAYIASKKAALDDAKTALADTQAEAEIKLEVLNVAQNAYDASVQNYTAVQEEYAQMENELTGLKADLKQKQDAYEAARSDMEETYTPEAVVAMQNLKESRRLYDKALSDLSAAEDGLKEAEEALSAAINAKDAADQSVSDKATILAEKQKALSDAKKVYYRALADLAIAQADYDRLKPAPITPAEPTVPVVSQPDADLENYVPQYADNSVYAVSHAVWENDAAPAASQSEYDYDVDAYLAVKDFKETNSGEISFKGRYSFVSFLNTFADIVRKSPHQNLLLDCSNQPWFSLNRKTLEALGSRNNKSLTVTFRYMGKMYTFTIPAGYDLGLLKDSNGWYGFMYLMAVFGGHETV